MSKQMRFLTYRNDPPLYAAAEKKHTVAFLFTNDPRAYLGEAHGFSLLASIET